MEAVIIGLIEWGAGDQSPTILADPDRREVLVAAVMELVNGVDFDAHPGFLDVHPLPDFASVPALEAWFDAFHDLDNRPTFGLYRAWLPRGPLEAAYLGPRGDGSAWG